MVSILVAVLLGVAFGLALARLALGGVLALAFSKARSYVKRMTQRRTAEQPVDSDRRHLQERRAG